MPKKVRLACNCGGEEILERERATEGALFIIMVFNVAIEVRFLRARGDKDEIGMLQTQQPTTASVCVLCGGVVIGDCVLLTRLKNENDQPEPGEEQPQKTGHRERESIPVRCHGH
jgi:hypothetical protein